MLNDLRLTAKTFHKFRFVLLFTTSGLAIHYPISKKKKKKEIHDFI